MVLMVIIISIIRHGGITMNESKFTIIKDRMMLKQIKEELQEVEGVFLVNAFKCDEVTEYCEKLNQILKIGYPISFTKERGDIFTKYVEYGYTEVGGLMKRLRWLIPYFKGSNWWIEIDIECLKCFMDYYFQNAKSVNLTFFELTNNFLMDIENGEDGYEYRIMKCSEMM